MSNCISFNGRIGRDCEVVLLDTGMYVCNFKVANNVGYGSNKETIWFNASLWGKKAGGSLPKFLKKGCLVFITGTLTQQPFINRDGNRCLNLNVKVSELDLLSQPGNSPSDESINQSSGDELHTY